MSIFNTKEEMIRTLATWDSMTFGDALAKMPITDKNKEAISLLYVVIDKQRLADKKMNGFCSEGLKKDEFERMGICYVDLFNLLEQKDRFWTPCDILYELCKHNLSRRSFYEKKAKSYKMTFDQVTWLMCGRALRALPSYIREYQLKNELQCAFPKAIFCQSEDLDRNFHCDVKMTLSDKDYYIWSFLSSTRSICQFVDKFSNNRYGVVVDGSHILCPFDRFEHKNASYRGWAFYSTKYIDEVRAAIFQREHADYDTIGESITNPSFYRRPVVVDKYQPMAIANQ
jgi:hypothetical protein